MRPPRVRVEAQGRSVEGVTAIVQNSDPYTYFGRRPIRINEGTGLETGTLGITVLTRATVLELPTVIARVFSGKAATVARHRRIEAFRDVTEATVTLHRRAGLPRAGGRGLHRGLRGARARGRAPKALLVVA